MDIKSKKTINAAFWYIITSFISKALLYIFTPLYTRLLTVEEFGEYNNFISWQNILVTLMSFDLAAAVSIAYYDFEEKKKFEGFINTISILSYLIPALFCVIILVFGEFFSSLFSIRKEYLFILSVYICLGNTINIFLAEQRVRLKYKLSALLTVGAAIGTVACTLIFVFLFGDKLKGILWGGILVNAIVSFIIAIWIWIRNRSFKKEYAKYALSIAVPLVPHVLASTILGSADKVMITRYCGDKYTAMYGLVYTISLVVTMVASSINKAWTPWFFDRLKNNKKKYIKPVSNIIVTTIGVGAFFLCLMAPEVLHIIGGESYQEAAVVMPPIIISCIVNCVSTFYINIEFYNKKTMGISVATVISAGVNVLLNWFFVKGYGYVAAAYTTVVSSILTLFFHIYKVKKQKMIDVFDNKYLLISVFVLSVSVELIIILYDMPIVRYIILAVLTIGVFTLIFLKKDSLIKIINSLRQVKEDE